MYIWGTQALILFAQEINLVSFVFRFVRLGTDFNLARFSCFLPRVQNQSTYSAGTRLVLLSPLSVDGGRTSTGGRDLASHEFGQ
jgi:hypothetical protein